MSDNRAPQQPSAIETVRSESFRRIYSNLFRYRILPAELSVVFNSVADTPGALGPNRVIEETEIVMSLSQAKLLCEHLSSLLSAYEQEFGAIKTWSAGKPDTQTTRQMIQNLKAFGL